MHFMVIDAWQWSAQLRKARQQIRNIRVTVTALFVTDKSTQGC